MALILAVGCGRQLNPDWCAQPGHSDPACDQLDAAQGSCTDHSDCPGAICLPGGVCADPRAVLHASPTGTGTACTADAKCLLATAIGLATPARKIILLERAIYTGAVTIDRDVQIVGNQATLQTAATGATVTVTNGATAELDDLVIQGSAAASGIACGSGALRARAVRITGNHQGIVSRCALTLERSVISANSDSALAIMGGSIDIHDNFIVNNGNDALATANVVIVAAVTGSFAFNTVAYNDAKQNTDPGVDCRSTAVTGDGNLVTDNTQRGVFGGIPQVVGTCDFNRSYTAPGAGGNDVHWVDVAGSDFHLTAASAAVLDSPAISCAERTDVDGDPRPMGAGCDFGADELPR